MRKPRRTAPKKVIRKASQKISNSIQKITRGLKSKTVQALSLLKEELPKKPAVALVSAQTNSHRPFYYGENTIVLLVRDPWWIFAYWEVTEAREKEIYDEVRRRGQNPECTALRVYDVTDSGGSFFDIEIGPSADNWYIDVGKPERQWVAELGVRTREGGFFAFVRSNAVKTPRYGVSNVIDEEWFFPDELYWKIFGLSTGFGKGCSSADVKEIMQRYLKGILSSENSSDLSPGRAPAKTSP